MYIKDDLGTKDILLLIRDDISKLQKDLLKQKKSPSTVNGIITLVKAVINHSIKEKGLVYINPFNGFKKLSVDDTRERFLSRDEVHQLLDKTKSNIMIHQFVKLALSTGARLQGVLHIKKKDISLANSSISINDFKGESTYMGFFDDELKEELKVGLVGLKANDYYIGGASTVVSSRIIQTSLKPILDKLFNVDLEADDSKNRVVIHTLRHTFASQLAKKGVPIFNIQKLMNHSEIEMTMRYAKLAPDHGIDVIKGLYN